ncbi:LysM peptidoglycan-binding domain-containing protein [Thalassotalea fusca]
MKPINKYLGLAIALIVLSACQQTPVVNKQPVEMQPQEAIEPTIVVPETTIAEKPLLPHEHQDVWQRIRSQLSIEVPDNEEVAKWREYYLSHPKFMVTIAQRAEPFLYYIVEEIERREMPVELALLPIVESSYLPGGVSHKSAVGLWQFMTVSARRFDIKQNWWYDGRRDIIESTRGALDYFEFFHDTFDEDWLNAIAAFNSGEGRVGRAIRRNKKVGLPTDFWSLKLPKETTNFVPKLLAISDILMHAEQYNYTFTPIENRPAVAIVDINGQLDLTVAASWADIDSRELRGLNPGLKRWATDPDNRYQLLIPFDSAEKFEQKLAEVDSKDWLRWHRFTVQPGDSLSEIGYRYGISVADIKKYNQLKSNLIRVGQSLAVPVAYHDGIPLERTKEGLTKLVHTVKRGDNLWDISRKYNVKVNDILKWNNLTRNSLLQPKQKLAILM